MFEVFETAFWRGLGTGLGATLGVISAIVFIVTSSTLSGLALVLAVRNPADATAIIIGLLTLAIITVAAYQIVLLTKLIWKYAKPRMKTKLAKWIQELQRELESKPEVSWQTKPTESSATPWDTPSFEENFNFQFPGNAEDYLPRDLANLQETTETVPLYAAEEPSNVIPPVGGEVEAEDPRIQLMRSFIEENPYAEPFIGDSKTGIALAFEDWRQLVEDRKQLAAIMAALKPVAELIVARS